MNTHWCRRPAVGRFLRTAVILLAALIQACGGGLPGEAKRAYEGAKEAVVRGDLEEAQRQFTVAIGAEPRFTEAWYNRGSVNARLAVNTIRSGDEQRALDIFRQSVDDKRRARELIDQGVWFIYKPGPEQDQVRHDLEMALKDVDEVLADEASLLQALRLWAGLLP
jgi:tetratricopeptide (TPR) repeat protein